MSFDVTLAGPAGSCVSYSGGGTWFCEEHMSKAPFYVPKGEGNFSIAQVAGMDNSAMVAVVSGTSSHCVTDRYHIACGHVFRPCDQEAEQPKPTGLCKSACERLCKCDHNCGGKGDFGELCDRKWTVDDSANSEDNDGTGKVLCGSASTTTARRALIGIVALTAINLLALTG